MNYFNVQPEIAASRPTHIKFGVTNLRVIMFVIAVRRTRKARTIEVVTVSVLLHLGSVISSGWHASIVL